MTTSINPTGITPVSVFDLLNWLEESWGQNPSTDQLALPAIQRDSVWRAKQVLELWRSVLAGMPIGMFYVQHQGCGEKVVRSTRDSVGKLTTWMTKLDTPHYDLLDGQQRLRALSLGLCDDPLHEGRTLWVVFKDGCWDLRLTSRMQPFGYDENGDRLRLSSRRNARETLEPNARQTPLAFVGKVPADRKGDTKVFDSDLYDYRVKTHDGAEIPFPPYPYGYDKRSALKMSAFLWGEDRSAVWPEAASEAAREQLEFSLAHLGKETAAVMVVGKDVLEGDRLPAFFRRVGAGGTPISEEEQLFAAFKVAQPAIRDIVHTIQSEVSAVFTPAQVMATIRRIAHVTASGNPWLPPFQASLDAIRAAYGTGNEKKSELSEQFTTLLPLDAKEARICKAFERAKDLLTGQGAELPDVVLAELAPELWQVLVYWCHRSLDRPTTTAHREEAARFAMFWMLCVENKERCARACFEIIANQSSKVFPGMQMYAELTGDQGQLTLFHPGDLQSFFQRDPDPNDVGTWMTSEERFHKDGRNPEQARLASRWWWCGRTILPWLQRAYIGAAFPGYLPLTVHEEDRPFDLDHILAQADYGRAQFPEGGKSNPKHRRWATGDTIGNFRLVESSTNRGDGDSSTDIKMPFLRDASNTEVGTAADFLIGEAEPWLELSSDEKAPTWSVERKKAFQTAVEHRAMRLYNKFFKDLGFEGWLESKSSSAS